MTDLTVWLTFRDAISNWYQYQSQYLSSVLWYISISCWYISIWSHEVFCKISILIEVDFRNFLIFNFFVILKQHCFLFLIFSFVVVLKQQLFLFLTCCFQNCMKWEWSEKVFSVWSKKFIMIVMKYTKIAWLIRSCYSWTRSN